MPASSLTITAIASFFISYKRAIFLSRNHLQEAANHKPQFTSRKLQATNNKPQFTSGKVQTAQYKPQITSHKLQAAITSRKLEAAANYKPQITRRKLQAAHYKPQYIFRSRGLTAQTMRVKKLYKVIRYAVITQGVLEVKRNGDGERP